MVTGKKTEGCLSQWENWNVGGSRSGKSFLYVHVTKKHILSHTSGFASLSHVLVIHPVCYLLLTVASRTS